MGSQANVFTTMPLIPYRIIMALMENDNFCKLMYYNTINALDKPALTIEQKQKLIWDGIEDHMENSNIFITNVQPNEEFENRTILKCYKYETMPNDLILSTLNYKFDVLFGSKIPIVNYQGIPCNRGDLIEMEIMRSLNGQDVAGVGFLQFNQDLSALCNSRVGIGNNYTFTGLTIIMATQLADIRTGVCQ